MDYHLKAFLSLVHHIIQSEGKDYEDKEFKFKMGANDQGSILYAPLLNRSPDIKSFLQILLGPRNSCRKKRRRSEIPRMERKLVTQGLFKKLF